MLTVLVTLLPSVTLGSTSQGTVTIHQSNNRVLSDKKARKMAAAAASAAPTTPHAQPTPAAEPTPAPAVEPAAEASPAAEPTPAPEPVKPEQPTTEPVPVVQPAAGFPFSWKTPTTPGVNRVTAGGLMGIKFSLGGDRGLGVLRYGYPQSQAYNCATGALQPHTRWRTRPFGTGLTYNAASGVYTYTWQTREEWSNTCRQFTMLLSDGTLHSTRFRIDTFNFIAPTVRFPGVNNATAGTVVPVRFHMGALPRLKIMKAGSPRSAQIDCTTGLQLSPWQRTLPSPAGSTGLTRNRATHNYRYAWKTLAAWTETCRRFEMRMRDSSVEALTFRFNRPPDAVNDTGADFSTDEASPFTTGSVLANDTDADGDMLVVTAMDTVGTVGTVTNNGDGTFTYNPNGLFESLAAGQSNTTTFGYTIADPSGASDSATVTITINGLNDAPTNIGLAGGHSVAENQAVGAVVGALSSTDVDTSDTHGYSLVAGAGDTDNAAFSIVGNSLRTAAVFDKEVKASYAIRIRTDDGHGGTFEKQFTITVTDGNDPPTAIGLANNTVSENQASGTTVGALSTTDEDPGDTHGYSLVSGAGSDDNGSFSICGAGLCTAAVFDKEIKSSYTVRIRSDDHHGGTFEQAFAITITEANDAPVVTPATLSVAENTANTTNVGAPVAYTDQDSGQTHTYSITAGNGTGGGAFGIDPTSGQISVNDVAQLNFEATPSFSLTVRVLDDGSPARSGTATITINLTDVNDAPVINDQARSIAENSPNATSVGAVLAYTDQDAGQTHTFAITNGNTNSAFAINTSTGQLAVNDVAQLNYEGANSSYSLTVSVTDNGTGALSDTAIITVTVTDVSEAPVVGAATKSIAENSANGTTVGIPVTYTDQDSGQAHAFSITAGNGTGGGAFAIDSSTGQLSVNDLSQLDYETVPGHAFSLTVKVLDNGSPALFGTATITINLTDANDAPVVTPATFSKAENSANTSAVGIVTFGDQDSPLQPPYTFSITAGNGTGGGAFAINASSGAITVNDSTQLDYETVSGHAFSLTVQVADNGSPVMAGTATITVNLSDVNEAPVIDDQSRSVAENSANTTNVGAVLAFTDQDAGQTHAFAITSGNTGSAFGINTSTGQITVADGTQLNKEGANPSYSLTVSVTDNGTGNLSDTATITVTITDVNEAPTVNAATFSIAENSANTTPVGTATFSDPDAGQTHTFSITAGNTSGAFAIDGTSGAITVANSAALDYETVPGQAFSLTVKVEDAGLAPALSDTDTVTVNLADANDAPVVGAATFSLPENSSNGTSVGTPVTFTDQDSPAQGHTYSITAGNGTGGGAFAIGSTSGQITVNDVAQLNFEATPTFNLTVQVLDDGSPNMSGTNTITINLTNVNDAPVITLPASPAAVPSVNTAISGVSLADADAGVATVQMGLSVDEGLLTLGSTAGLDFSFTDGNGTGAGTGTDDAAMTFRGTLATINAALAGLTYDSNGFGGLSVTLSASANDLGNTGPGGALTDSDSTSILLNQPPTASNLSAPETYTEDTALNLTDIVAGDVDNTTLTATLTLSDVDAGSLSVGTSNAVTSTYNGTTGVWTASGLTADVNALLSGVTFTPAQDYNAAFTIATSVTDGNASVTGTKNMTGTPENDAPVLANVLVSLDAVAEDSVAPVGAVGTLVSALVDFAGGGGLNNVSEVDSSPLLGLVITAVDETQGSWHYSLDGGANWFALGVTGSNARALAADTDNRVYFQPNTNFSGTIGSALTFRAWDRTTGTDGSSRADTGTNGGTTAYSAATDTASIVVTAINDAPVLGDANVTFNNEPEDAVSPVGAVGTLVSALVDLNPPGGGLDNVSDADPTDPTGMAITAADTANGDWYYTTDDGTNWILLGLVDNAAALLLAADANNRLYFVPDGNYNGSSSVTFRAWDSSAGVDGSPADSSTNGGTTAFSTATDTASLTITAVNDPPVITSANTASVPENTTSVLTVTSSDQDLDTVTYTVTGGADQARFAVNLNSGALTFIAPPNFEAPSDADTNNIYIVQVTADDGNTGLTNQTISVTVTDVDEAPIFSSSATPSVPENSTAVVTVAAADPEGATVGYSITGGADEAKFALDSITHALSFLVAPDFESPTDVGANNVYEVQVTASDATPNATVQNISVTVTNVNEPPSFTSGSSNSIPENTTAAQTVTATDPDAATTLNYTIVAGGDGGLFSIGLTSGALTFNSAPNFEAPADIGENNVYDVTVRVTDGSNPVTQGVAISVTNVNEAPTANGDTYSALGNTQLRAAGATGTGLLGTTDTLNPNTNDTDPDSLASGFATLSVTPSSGNSTNSGQFQTFTDGSFHYTPAAGFSGADTFTYQLTDGTNTVPGTVTVNVSTTRVWYVRDVTDAQNPSTSDDGRSTNAFDSIAEFNLATTNNADIVFIYAGNTATTPLSGGVTLKDGQKLWGEGVGLAVAGFTPATLVAAGAQPRIQNSAGDVVSVPATAGSRQNVEIRGVDLNATGVLGSAIDVTSSGANVVGVTISNNTVSGATGEGIDLNAVSTGAFTATVSNTSITSVGTGLDARSSALGTLTVTAAANTITATAGNGFDARTLAGAGTINVALTTAVVSASGTGIVVDSSAAGTATVTGFANNTVSGTTGGTGILINDATFDGTPGGAFQTVNAGTIVVGATGAGNGVGGSAVVLTTVLGDVSFSDLDAFADNGAALRASSTNAFNAATGAGLRLVVGAGVGTVSAVNGPAIDFAFVTGTLPLALLTSTNSTSNGVTLTSFEGSLSAATGSTITNSTAADFLVSAGAANVTYDGTITDDVGRLVDVNGTTGGTKAFTGAITDNDDGDGTETGVSLTNNTGATISFRGGLLIRTTTNAAFTATGGGTVEVCDENPCNVAATGALINTLTTTAGTALNVSNTTVSSNGLEFRSISANGGSAGIVLSNTSASGGLKVTGTGSPGTGGTIQNIAGRGASFISARNISLSWVNFTNANTVDGATSDGVVGGNENTDENGAIHLSAAVNVSLSNIAISGTTAQHGINGNNVTNLDLTNVSISSSGDEVWESGIFLWHLKGLPSASQDSVWNNVDITDSAQFNVAIINASATGSGEKDKLTIQSGSTFTNSGKNVIGDHITVFNSGTANFQVVVDTVTFTSKAGGEYAGAHTSDGIQVDVSGVSARSDATVTGSTFTGDGAGQSAINMSGTTGIGTFLVQNNNAVVRAAVGINVAVTGSASLSGTISGNTLGTSVTNNPGQGINIVEDTSSGTITLNVFSNTIQGADGAARFDYGLRAGARAGSGQVHITLAGNIVQSAKSAGVWLFSGNNTGGETSRTCVNFSTSNKNSLRGDAGTKFADYFLEQYTGTTFNIQGLSGSGASAPNVQAFVASSDSVAGRLVSVSGGTTVNYTNATCNLP
jgi:hypothetical protein